MSVLEHRLTKTHFQGCPITMWVLSSAIRFTDHELHTLTLRHSKVYADRPTPNSPLEVLSKVRNLVEYRPGRAYGSEAISVLVFFPSM